MKTTPRMNAPTTRKLLPSNIYNLVFPLSSDGSVLTTLAIKDDPGKKKIKNAARHPRNMITFPISGIKMAQTRERQNQIITMITRCRILCDSWSTGYPKLKNEKKILYRFLKNLRRHYFQKI